MKPLAFSNNKTKYNELLPDEDDDDDDYIQKFVKTPSRTPKPLESCKNPKLVKSGVYKFVPNDHAPYAAHCHLPFGTDLYTVILYRNGGKLSFERSYEEYENGFGSVDGEHWLGLKLIYLTRSMSVYNIWLKGENCEKQSSDASKHYMMGEKMWIDRNYNQLNMTVFSNNIFSKIYQNTNTAECADRFTGGWWYFEDDERDCLQFTPTAKYVEDENGKRIFPVLGCKVTEIIMALTNKYTETGK